MQRGDRFGRHRVLEPKGVLPQPAWKLDADSPLWDNELLIEVERLTIDSASFRQIAEEAGGDRERMREIIRRIVTIRGKMHNPVTDSGGMLIGRVKDIGPLFPGKGLERGDRIATLVSLSLTPLRLEEIVEIDLAGSQVVARGEAILFETGLWVKLPEDLPEKVALSALDVCGAPAQVARLVKRGDRVLVTGAGGKSGLLSLYQAKKMAGNEGLVIALEKGKEACEDLRKLSIADRVLEADLQDAVSVMEKVSEVTKGEFVDLVIQCVNVPDAEMAAILSVRDGGKIYFFSMATRFTAAALGAEGVGKEVEMLIGNGYTPGHAELALEIFRESPPLLELFKRRYGGK
ncbi:zinc-binding dehydrogenase [Thermicanus aegyptius]|uniref:L-erythro-3,5-diaminohexanoate dehydrogenase n=1 Tax=Thermicanus aegyptius TaxID=94009 RepID=UPI0004081284|nr:zinc-binding dehydrogenase [Thermicanus aegyptius]